MKLEERMKIVIYMYLTGTQSIDVDGQFQLVKVNATKRDIFKSLMLRVFEKKDVEICLSKIEELTNIRQYNVCQNIEDEYVRDKLLPFYERTQELVDLSDFISGVYANKD